MGDRALPPTRALINHKPQSNLIHTKNRRYATVLYCATQQQ